MPKKKMPPVAAPPVKDKKKKDKAKSAPPKGGNPFAKGKKPSPGTNPAPFPPMMGM